MKVKNYSICNSTIYPKKFNYKGELYPHEAYFLMQNENSYLVDIRTKEELNLVGLFLMHIGLNGQTTFRK